MASLLRKANREKRMDTNMSGGDETRGIKGEAATGGWTAGPWHVEQALDEVDQRVRKVIAVPVPGSACGKHVAHIATWGGDTNPEANANARLIAAAPEMAAILSRLAEMDNAKTHTTQSARAALQACYRDARALLARVGGGA